MSKLRDILIIPEVVKKTDFVVELADAVNDPGPMLAQYAVTPDLQHAFLQCLGKVHAALDDGRSFGAHIHGSFGSGKSHFMAALSLVLDGHEAPWAVEALHPVLEKHEWVKQKRLLRLHFNMLGAESLESRVLGGYLSFMEKHHPDAEVPGIFQDEPLFQNADALRVTLGDEAFFAKLNAGGDAAESGGWGNFIAATGISATWNPDSYAAARGSAVAAERTKLFSALVKTLFPAFRKSGSAWVDFDLAMATICRHAKGLGYDGIVLFLDELILWLAGLAANLDRLNAEIQKMARLVESQTERRAVPVMSFIARQRAIKELVGEALAGADVQRLEDSLKWWEGRFDVIELPDRNLPAIIEKRVVRAKSVEAGERLRGAFEQMRTGLGSAAEVLRGEGWTDADFRQVYPFSPALVQSLVALSHYLQRDRTALRVLTEILIEHTEDFALGSVMPVGDLFDVLAGSAEPMDGAMRDLFQAARRLYQDELLPLLWERHGTGTEAACQRLRRDHPVRLGCSNCAQMACRTDNRLLKSLILAALVPNVPVLRTLTASRLVKLNHGVVRSIIPGAEMADAVGRLRHYAASCGKVRVGDEADPGCSMALTGVELGPILDKYRQHDNAGARRRRLRDLLFEAVGLPLGEPKQTLKVGYRGTDRAGTVLFGNVRELEDSSFAGGNDEAFRVVVDYPFDVAEHGPHQDEQRVAAWLDKHPAGANTVVWLPSFFGASQQKALGELLVHEAVLADRQSAFAEYPLKERESARMELESVRGQKKAQILRALGSAYGVTQPHAGDLDESRTVEEHFRVLLPGQRLGGVIAANLKDALQHSVQELLRARWPRHPEFNEQVTPQKLAKALAHLVRLRDSEQGRLPIEKSERKELDAPQALQLVSATDSWVAFEEHTFQEIDKRLRQKSDEVPTARDIRVAFLADREMGLTPEIRDFVVMAYATHGNREIRYGGRILADVKLGKLSDDVEVVTPRMPDPQVWGKALNLAGTLFGYSLGGKALNPANLRSLAEQLWAKADAARKAGAGEVASLLAQKSDFFDVAGKPPRLKTAERVAELLQRMTETDPVELLETFAATEVGDAGTAMARHMRDAEKTVGALKNAVAFQALLGLKSIGDGDERFERAAEVLAELAQVLGANEIQHSLSGRLQGLALQAQEIISPPIIPPPIVELIAEGAASSVQQMEEALKRAREAMQQAGEGASLEVTWRITRPRRDPNGVAK